MPITTLTHMKSILQPAILIHQESDCMILEETDSKAKLKKIAIIGLGKDAIGIKHDKLQLTKKLVINTDASLKGCDAIIFFRNENKGMIMFCELKSESPEIGKVRNQLRSATCFVNYLSGILEVFHRDDKLQSWPSRYFLFYLGKHNPLEKRTTAYKPRIDNTSPDHPEIKIVTNGQNLYLRHLLGKV